ncbi:MAG: single-stranded-DNA-specific exonuclease RecJ [Spirochaetales bacterium]|nr:single-stranded-DNA-specific exonuclease RecJ [Spirochaetales bacterium]
MKWTKNEVDSGLVREFSARYKVDLLPAAIFVRRGLTDPEQLRFFFEDDLRFLHNPFLLDEMGDAVDRILLAVSEGEKVHVFGDRDVDGVTSTVLMTDTLRSLGLEVSWAVPMGDSPYGLTREVVDECIAEDVTLLVAVDCGTTNAAEIQYAVDHGIDTVVVDHHNPQEDRPPAIAIVNPKLPDSSYPFDGLCACALVGKVRYALGFARSELYNQTICLLNIRPGNESLILDVIKMENLIEISRISENLMPGVLDVEHSRLGDFLLGVQILVYDAPSQDRLLRQAFGENVDIHIIDVAPELWKQFPSLENKSLLRLRAQSRLARYGGGEPSEIDVFASLFQTFAQRKEEALQADFQTTLDLVGLATLADMMPMRDENRILVKRGLKQMSDSPRGGLRELLERQKLLGKNIETRDIGWSLSPVLNAAGRMGEPDKAVRLFLAADEGERAAAADQIIELNNQRRQIGDAGWDLVQDQARSSHEAHAGKFIVVSSEQIHRGITGILAGRLARQYKTPVAVVTVMPDRAIGSVRSDRGLVATDLLARCDDILLDWGGHDAAAGFHLLPERLKELEGRLQEIIKSIPMEEGEEEAIDVDAELPLDFLNPSLGKVVELFAPFGQEHPPLVFLAKRLGIASITIMGKNEDHLRLLLESGRHKWPAVFWGAADRVRVDFDKGDTVDAVFRLGTNFYQGRASSQLTILDIRRSAPGDP